MASRLHIDPPLAGCDLGRAFEAVSTAPCHVDWGRDDTVLVIAHRGAIFRADTRYTFKLDPGVRDPAGVVNDLDHHWELTTGAAPGVSRIGPGDGATGVPVDAPLAVTFGTAMDPVATAAAIRLAPPVPGTAVRVNSRDPSRFLVLPGRLLAPHARYSILVGTTATDSHGAPLGGPARATFTTGGIGGGPHALVLGGRPGEPAAAVLLAGTSAGQDGDPLAAVPVLEAPRCALAERCGSLAGGAPLTAFLDAVLSPDATHAAVVERDLAAGAQPNRLVLVDILAGTALTLAGDAGYPSWAPDGRLAFGTGADVRVVPAGGGVATVLPPGPPLAGRPAWSGDGAVLALPVRDAAGTPGVELADPRLAIRYPAPGLDGSADHPALSADGTELAVRRLGGADPFGSGWVVRLRIGDAAPRLLATGLTPLGFGGTGTLVGLVRSSGDTALVRVSVAAGDLDRLSGSPRPADLDSVVAGAGGRLLGYVAPDRDGIVQAWVENSDGSNPVALTAFSGGGLEAVSVALTG